VKKSWEEKKLFSTARIEVWCVVSIRTHSVEEERRTNLSGHAGVFGVI